MVGKTLYMVNLLFVLDKSVHMNRTKIFNAVSVSVSESESESESERARI